MCHAETMLGELGQFFNLIIMDQTQVNFCLILKKLATWAGIELLGFVQINDSNWIMKKGVGTAESMLHEQLLCDNLLEFIQSLEEFVESRNNPKFLKFIMLVLNGRNMKEETISAHLSIHTMNCYKEDIESGFLMFLEKPMAYPFDPLDTSKEVFILLAGPMIDYLASVIWKESNCRVSSSNRVSEVVLKIRLFESDSARFQQWDPGDQAWFSTTILPGDCWNKRGSDMTKLSFDDNKSINIQ
jgi:hypothetical protein